MKKLLLLPLAFLAHLAPGASPLPPAPAEWTILIFLNGDNNLEKFALKDFTEMSRVSLPDNVNVILQFDRNGGYATTSPNWTQTLRFKMRKGLTPLPANALQDLGELNMGAQQTLADFVAWGQAQYPARKTGLILWDHGDGWRFFNTILRHGTPEMKQQLKDERLRQLGSPRVWSTNTMELGESFELSGLPAIPVEEAVDVPHRAVSNDDSSGGDKLFNREVQDALQSVGGGRKLDLVGFDACLMAMVETGFALRNVAGVMVGSEELEPGNGWDYSDWLPRLTVNPAQNAEQLGQALVDSYRKTYAGVDSSTTLSAVRLGRIDALSAALDALADTLQPRLGQPAFLATLTKVRDDCVNYAPGYDLNGIDLGDFCQALEVATTDSAVKAACQAVRAELSQAVIANYAGRDRVWSTGLAIYFPKSAAFYRADPDAAAYDDTQTVPGEVEFIKAHRWDNFLQAYFQHVP